MIIRFFALCGECNSPRHRSSRGTSTIPNVADSTDSVAPGSSAPVGVGDPHRQPRIVQRRLALGKHLQIACRSGQCRYHRINQIVAIRFTPEFPLRTPNALNRFSGCRAHRFKDSHALEEPVGCVIQFKAPFVAHRNSHPTGFFSSDAGRVLVGVPASRIRAWQPLTHKCAVIDVESAIQSDRPTRIEQDYRWVVALPKRWTNRHRSDRHLGGDKSIAQSRN